MIKQCAVAFLVIVFLVSGILLLPAKAEVKAGEAIVSVKDLFSMAQRKSYRLGIKAGLISTSDNINLNKDSNLELGFEFDAKLNENLDCGPRIGYISKKLLTSSIDASYSAVKFGFGGRMYLAYWGDYGSTHGFVNAYISGQGDYYIVSQSSAVITTSPSSFAGLGVYAGTGVELAFGPNTGGFAEVGYQKTNIKSSDNKKLPIDGIVIAVGTRLAFN